MNLLLREPMGVAPIGVAIDDSFACAIGESILDVRHILCGSQTNDCRPMNRSFLGRAAELLKVEMLDSGRRVAIEARLFGCKTWFVP